MSNEPRRSVGENSLRIRKLVGGCLATWLVVIPSAAHGVEPQVHIVAAPAGSFVPDVVTDGEGVVHMVYARNRNAEYVRFG